MPEKTMHHQSPGLNTYCCGKEEKYNSTCYCARSHQGSNSAREKCGRNQENLGELLDAYQARKTLGLSLIGMGRIEEGKRELTRYVAAMKKALDDNVLPGDLLSAR